MQQHRHLLKEHEQGGGGAGDATREASAGSAALVQRLEHLLSERQELVAQLDALRSRLDQLADEQQSLLADLQTLLPPEGNPLV